MATGVHFCTPENFLKFVKIRLDISIAMMYYMQVGKS